MGCLSRDWDPAMWEPSAQALHTLSRRGAEREVQQPHCWLGRATVLRGRGSPVPHGSFLLVVSQ